MISTYIFFSWERFLKAPVASRVVISLLLRRLVGVRLKGLIIQTEKSIQILFRYSL